MPRAKNRRKKRLQTTRVSTELKKQLNTARETGKLLQTTSSYTLTELYKGSVTELMLAEDRSHARGFTQSPDVVLKFPRPETYEEGVKSLKNDDRALGGLKLDHVVQIKFRSYQTHPDAEPTPYEEIEYMDAGTILDLMRMQKELGVSMPWQLAAFITSRVTRGLNRVYRSKSPEGEERRIVHRDISPDNIGMDFIGQVKLMDFGSAMPEGSHHSEVAEIGKPEYASPEQLNYALLNEELYRRADGSGSLACIDIEKFLKAGTKNMTVSIKDDIYSLGVLTYEMITGKNPNHVSRAYEGYELMERLSQTHERRLRQPLPSMECFTECDERLSALVDRCMSHDPDRRPNPSELTYLLEQEMLYKDGYGPTNTSLATWLETIHNTYYDAEEFADAIGSTVKEQGYKIASQKERWKDVARDCPFLKNGGEKQRRHAQRRKHYRAD